MEQEITHYSRGKLPSSAHANLWSQQVDIAGGKDDKTSSWFDVQKRANFKVILCYVQIPSQLFDLRAVCRGNNELFLVPWNKTLKFLTSCLVSK
jgi:hypothetical protein